MDGEAYFAPRNGSFGTHSGPSRVDTRRRYPPRPCEKAMFKSLCGSGPEARLGLLAV